MKRMFPCYSNQKQIDGEELINLLYENSVRPFYQSLVNKGSEIPDGHFEF